MKQSISKTILYTFIISMISVLILLILLHNTSVNKTGNSNLTVNKVDYDVNYVDYIYKNEDIDIILRTISIPEEYRIELFDKSYWYSIDYLYKNMFTDNDIDNIDIDDNEFYKNCLYLLNYNLSNQYDLKNILLSDVNNEISFSESITDDFIEELPNDTLEDGYIRYMYRRIRDSIPILVYKDIIDGNIVYIYKSKYGINYFQLNVDANNTLNMIYESNDKIQISGDL